MTSFHAQSNTLGDCDQRSGLSSKTLDLTIFVRTSTMETIVDSEPNYQVVKEKEIEHNLIGL